MSLCSPPILAGMLCYYLQTILYPSFPGITEEREWTEQGESLSLCTHYKVIWIILLSTEKTCLRLANHDLDSDLV